MKRAFLLVLDLLVLLLAGVALLVSLTGGGELALGPVETSAHDPYRALLVLALLLALRGALSRREGPGGGLLGPPLALLRGSPTLRRGALLLLTLGVLAAAIAVGWDWQRERGRARGAALLRASWALESGAARLARVTRPLPDPWTELEGEGEVAARGWRSLVGPVHPSSARLRLAFGLMAEAGRWAPGSEVRFRALARPEGAGEGEERVLAEEILCSSEAAERPGWRELAVDLTPFAGVRLELLLEVEERGEGKALPFAFWARPPAAGPPPGGPSVILVSIDTLRADHLGCYGYGRRPTSPNLDRLASEGTRFAQVIAPSPWTTPSHMSLFTSQYPTVHAVDAPIASAQRRLAGDKTTLAELLRDRGYRTAAFTGAGAISALYGFWQGFDLYDETPRGATGREGEDLPVIYGRARAWLESEGERPFFLFLHTYEVHNPYTHGTFLEDGEDYGELERRTRLYDGGIAFADGYLGRLRGELERLGLAGTTLLVVLSDHGEDLAGRYPADHWYYHGHNLYDELLLVPLVFSGPGVARGRVVGDQVSLLDVMPTLLELTGTEGPGGQPVQGLSLAPHLDPRGAPAPGEGPGHPYAFAEAVNRGPERKAVRTSEHKLVWMPSPDQTGRSPVRTPIPTLELLDLRGDPGETRNLVAEQSALARRLFESLERWWSENRGLRREVGEEAAEMDPSTLETLKALGYL